jgi:hypothetical protein
MIARPPKGERAELSGVQDRVRSEQGHGDPLALRSALKTVNDRAQSRNRYCGMVTDTRNGGTKLKAVVTRGSLSFTPR